MSDLTSGHFDPHDAAKLWATYDNSERGRGIYAAASEAVNITGRPVDIAIDVDFSEFERGMREVGEAFAAIGDILAERWSHVAGVITDTFAPIYAVTPGGPWSARIGEPIHTEADARDVLEFVDGVDLWPGKRATKAWRRYAKARHLECKRALGRGHRRALAGARVNKFGAT